VPNPNENETQLSYDTVNETRLTAPARWVTMSPLAKVSPNRARPSDAAAAIEKSVSSRIPGFVAGSRRSSAISGIPAKGSEFKAVAAAHLASAQTELNLRPPSDDVDPACCHS
jgi:hypothetical protein